MLEHPNNPLNLSLFIARAGVSRGGGRSVCTGQTAGHSSRWESARQRVPPWSWGTVLGGTLPLQRAVPECVWLGQPSSPVMGNQPLQFTLRVGGNSCSFVGSESALCDQLVPLTFGRPSQELLVYVFI